MLLRLQAFGPFAGVQEIDFRRLGGNSFFLIHGPTGSGKTSVLDGMCFALFGDSSGGEREGRQMRSHHADAATLTQLEFEFALGQARYRVLRVPEQTRKALRGGGEVNQKPRAELFAVEGEGADATERPLATGWSKVNEYIVRLLGFDSRQFRQVIVLPQGRFFEFLKASSQEREKILQVLFGTELYKRVEESLKRAADELQARGRAERERRAALLEQAAVVDEAELATREAGQRAVLEEARATAAHSAVEARAAEDRLAQARQDAQRFAEHDAAALALQALRSQQDQESARRQALARMKLAARLRPLEQHWQQARTESVQARALAAQRTQALERAGQEEAAARSACERQEALAPRREQLAGRIAQLAELSGRVGLLAQAQADHAAARQRQQRASQQLEQAGRAHAEAGQACESLQGELARVGAEAASLEAAGAALRHAQSLRTQRLERDRLLALCQTARRQVDTLQSACEARRARAEQAMQLWQQAMAHWLAGQSARIARELQAGQPCPVCGSHEHPSPAHASGDAASDEQLAAAEGARDRAADEHRQAQEALAAARLRLAQAEGGLETAQAALGAEASDDLGGVLTAATDALKRAQAAAAGLPQLRQRLDAARQRLQEAATALERAQADGADAARELQHRATQCAERQAGIPAELAQPAALAHALQQARLEAQAMHQALKQAQDAAAQQASALARAIAFAEESARTRTQREQLEQARAGAFEDGLRELGFADADDWRAAHADDPTIAAQEEHTAAFDRAFAAASERVVRSQAAVQDLLRPDVAAAEIALRDAQARQTAASDAVRDVLAKLQNTSGFIGSLARIAQSFDDIERRHADLRTLADAAVGQNPQRMSFQRYVLATLLEEVLAATTLRLRVMSRGRYEMRRRLVAMDARSAGGLDLDVFDHYTGTTRGVDTLSGGESFLASLALALGLSDVVQSHAGGIRLDAIFVDEGFGTLDPEALDFAIRTLKDLQRSGRMVGIISHVAELREWMDARLELLPSQDGSRARFVT
ncbi:SMC family ATPase [Ramlibacter aurantiacus]|uniref:SMC family ATPase n=1 Tax=Ramlibacter aurantiacus TaxID=2801330 RepID=UPI00338E8258